MAMNHIPINQGAGPFAADLAQSLRQLVSAQEKLTFLKAKMDQMIDGSDYSALETSFGLPAGKGDEVYNLLVGSLTHFTASSSAGDASLRDFLAWVGVPA